MQFGLNDSKHLPQASRSVLTEENWPRYCQYLRYWDRRQATVPLAHLISERKSANGRTHG